MNEGPEVQPRRVEQLDHLVNLLLGEGQGWCTEGGSGPGAEASTVQRGQGAG